MTDQKLDPALFPDYDSALKLFDAALCEALAVGQGATERIALPHISWATHVFARVCAHGTAMVRAAPRSRWVESESEDWNFCTVAPHARAILEGVPFFLYLIEHPKSDAEWQARLSMMHLNDCTRRVKLFSTVPGDGSKLYKFKVAREALVRQLESNEYFAALPATVRKKCLEGEKPWLKTRQQIMEMAGIDAATFELFWMLYSQHSHVLTLSFYSLEANGRGTGLPNEVDAGYMAFAMQHSTALLKKATDWMTILFPDTKGLRKGCASTFAPGPKSNDYKLRDPTSVDFAAPDQERSPLSRNIHSLMNVQQRLRQ